MAGPITWRSITAPSDASGVSLLNQAGQSINNAFGAFDKAIGNVTQNRQKEYDHLVDTNTQAFMDEVAKYRTAEELQAARDAGVFDRMRSGFNGDVDSKAIRDLVPQTMQTLQQRTLTNNQYLDDTQGRKERPIWDDLMLRARNNDRAGIERILSEQELLNEGEKSRGLYEILDGNEDRSMQRTRFGWERDNHLLNVKQREMTAGIDNLVTSTMGYFDPDNARHTDTFMMEALRNQFTQDMTPTQRNQAETLLRQRLASRKGIEAGDQPILDAGISNLSQAYGMHSNIYNGYDPQSAPQAVNDMVQRYVQTDDEGNKLFLGIKDSDKRRDVIKKLRTWSTTGYELEPGVTIPIPPTVLEDAVMTLRDIGTWNSVDDFDKAMKEFIEKDKPGYLEQFNRYTQFDNAQKALKKNARAYIKGEYDPFGGNAATSFPKPSQPEQETKAVPTTAIDKEGQQAQTESVPAQLDLPKPTPRQPLITEDNVESFNNVRDMTLREGVSRAFDWLANTRESNLIEGRERKNQQIKDIALGNIETSKAGLSQLLRQNPTLLVDLAKSDKAQDIETLNALRNKYGEAFINGYLK